MREPLTESNAYALRTGKVTKVMDGRSIVLKLESGSMVTVYLAGIDPKGNDNNIIKLLSDTILGKKVITSGNKERESDGSFFGVVVIPDKEGRFFDVNRRLLENGMAGFVEPSYTHSVSDNTTCIYRHIVEKAKKEKVGIWAK